VTEQELEQALRQTLRPVSPGAGFADRVMTRIGDEAAGTDSASRPARLLRPSVKRWAPVAVAACLLAGVGIAHWKREALQQEHGLQARAQLLQALNIASDQLNRARSRVIRQEDLTP
jgi:hypothetical protein